MRLYPEATLRFLESPTSGLNTPSSRDSYRASLRALQAACPDKRVGDFTESDLVDFVGRSHLSPATKAGYRTRVSGFFSWAKWQGLIEEDPSANLKRLVPGSHSKPVSKHYWYTNSEVRRIFAQFDLETVRGRRDHVAIRLGFSTGLRRSELASLTWDQVDLSRRQINLRGKGGKQASVYIIDSLLEVLEDWRKEAAEGLGREPASEPVVVALQTNSRFSGDGWDVAADWTRPVKPDTLGKLVSEVSDRSGVPFRAHDMRRSFAGIMHEAVGIEKTSAALRHANLGTTQRYLEGRQDAAYQAVKGAGLDL